MKRDDINRWIAAYTVSNADYMRSGVNNGNYNCYNGEGYTCIKEYLNIPSYEKLLSFFDIGILSTGKKGLAFTDKGVYGRDRFDDCYHYDYSDYTSFYESYSGFSNDNVQDIMYDIYQKISEYESKQKRNTELAVGGSIIGGLATIFAGISVLSEIENQKSKITEQKEYEDIIKSLSDIFK